MRDALAIVEEAGCDNQDVLSHLRAGVAGGMRKDETHVDYR